MTNEIQETEFSSLGELLKKTRIAQGLEIEQLGAETRISISNLKAMEADDYGSLPADAFARGFYALYAKALHLDPNKIVARFLSERGVRPIKESISRHNPLPGKVAQQVSSMAEPSMVSPVSTVGYILLLLIIIAGGICWYFDINPATYISEKLRGVQDQQVPAVSPENPDSSDIDPADAPNAEQQPTSILLKSRQGTVELAASQSIPFKNSAAAVTPQKDFSVRLPVESRF